MSQEGIRWWFLFVQNFSFRESNFSKFAQNKSYGSKNTKNNNNKKTTTVYIYLEITGDTCNLIDSKQCDLFPMT